MKKNLLLLLILAGFSSITTAQITIFEDFDSYQPGDDIVQVNPTYFQYWPGGSTGLQVSDVQAFSGTNSLYLYSNTGGGPADVIMDFQDKYDSGTANLSFMMYVSPDHGAYFNVQAEATAGQVWASNVSFFANGTVEFGNSDNTVAASSLYPQGEWFQIAYQVNLDENVWELSLNGKCIASYANPANSFASFNLYPFSGSGNAEFWFDDMRFEHSPDSKTISRDVSLAPGDEILIGFEGNTFTNAAVLINNLGEEVTSAAIAIEYPGSDQQFMLDNLSVGEGDSLQILVPTPIYIQAGITEMVVKLVSVNGEEGDDINCNNNLYSAVTAVTPTPRKAVLAEEATGTWCQFCPRGAVIMEEMHRRYGDNYVGIAVHNGDPMVVEEYDAGFATINGFSGYPNIAVDRVSAFSIPNVASVETPFISRISQPIRSAFEIGATLDDATNELSICVNVEAIGQLNFADKLVVAIVEDHVTGTESGYAQVNAFSGGTAEVGGYENLPNPVPASMMVYDDVARALLTPFDGMDMDIATTIPAGGSKLYNFNFTIDSEWDQENVNLVAFMLNNGGTVDNAFEIDLADAISKGCSTTSVNDPELQASFEVYPNPAADLMNIKITAAEKGDVQLKLINIYGQTVQIERLQSFVGTQNWVINVSDLPNGVYMANVQIGNKTAVKKVYKIAK
jgi:hypothetical protein